MTTIRNLNNELVETSLLMALVCLIEERGVSAAARRLGKSQPAVSQVLGQLRLRFNDPLLVRAGSRMHPTPRGLALARDAAEVVSRVRLLSLSSRGFDPRTEQGRFVISAPEYVDQLLTPILVERLAQVSPSAELQVKPPNPGAAGRQLESGEVDLRIGWVDSVDPATRSRLLYSEQQVCLARGRHSRIRGPLSLHQFAEAEHIRLQVSAPSTASRSIDQAVRQAGLHLKVKAVVPSLMTLARIVAGTDMLATVPVGVADIMAGVYKLQILQLPFSAPAAKVAMYWHEKHQHDARHTWLRSLVAKAAGSREK